MIKLSKRLQAVANCVPQDARLADIGSDHAKLPIELIEEGKIEFAIAGEVIRGPYEITKEAVAHYNICPRLADGLAAIELIDAIDTIVIAGMGGVLISEILEMGKKKLETVTRLILQPNNEEAVVRNWLTNNDFLMIDEQILEDKDKIYELIVAEHGSEKLTEIEILFGRKIRQSKIFQKKWRRRITEIDKILSLLPERKVEDRTKLQSEKLQLMEVLHEN